MCRTPLHCILPPYILTRIAQHGTPAAQRRALHQLLADPTLRIVRASTAGPIRGQVARLRAAADTTPPPTPLRTIRDAGGTMQAPGPGVARREGEAPTGDAAVDEAYEGLGATFDLYWHAYERNSIDGEGLPLDATVHYGQDYANAFWDGRQMVFGDGDGEYFRRFTIAVDIMGHELTHGVIEAEAGLAYYNQSGALNESLADVFGALVKQRALGQSAERADWLIGAGLFTDAVNGSALRSMAEPGTAFDDPVLGRDPQPAHMDDFVFTLEDNGGVHVNSGIPNKAFHLAALSIGGNAWDGAGRVWYHALLDPLVTANTDFAGFARVTARVAERLYGRDSEEATAVGDAWAAVGVV
ncbi:M4 family metallopeptidase [Parvularcula dongshanensis]|uniref:Neutral metalloproteinase n=1 Tax=Parvularcula dongshanensis TaxID=1173995 RepID=A0A840I870_9PROT|nr:M4 family metallopeptidase [Parvularcula dongshanensis]MBB4660150.1 Zn-dependent metalloprotease [Parvularcula dongshanensis]